MRELERYVGADLFRRDAVQAFSIRRSRALGILTGAHIFAEMIQTRRHSGVVAASRRFQGGRKILTRDKPPCQAAGCAMGSDPTAKAGTFCQFEQYGPKHL